MKTSFRDNETPLSQDLARKPRLRKSGSPQNKISALLSAISKRSWFCAGLFSIPFAFMLTYGASAYANHSICKAFALDGEGPLNLGAFILFLAVSWLIVAGMLEALARWKPKTSNTLARRLEKPLAIPIVWIALFACWIPCLLAYWPGTFPYDMAYQTSMVVSGDYTTFHPPIHTGIWSLCIILAEGLPCEAITLYAVIQMLFLSGCFTLLIIFLARWKVGTIALVLTFLFFAINPVIAIFSITPTKDIYFAGFLVIIMTLLFDLAKYSEEFFNSILKCTALALSLAFAYLFRNNAAWAIIPACIILLFVINKTYRKKWIGITVASVFVFAVVSVPIYTAFGVVSSGSNEMLSVPLQQVARVASSHSNELTDEDKEQINEYVPFEDLVNLYNPRFADPVKTAAREKHGKLSAFVGAWMNLGLRYPGEYLDAAVDLNIPSWYLFAHVPDPYSKNEYIETFRYDLDFYSVEGHSHAPALLPFCESVASFKGLENIPIVSLLFSPSTPIWVILLCIVILLRKRRVIESASMLVPLLYWCTFLLGPVVAMRYQFPLFALFPVIICTALYFPEKSPNTQVGYNEHQQADAHTSRPRKERGQQVSR